MVAVHNTKKSKRHSLAVLVHGKPKAGKTTFASTAPSPVFIVPEQERGLTSLEDRAPGFDYIPVNSIEDMEDAGRMVAAEYIKRKWGTIVIDPFTTYALLADVLLAAKTKGMDRRQYYGMLRQHLLDVWRMFQGVPLHTIWVCHSVEADAGFDETELRPAGVGKAIDAIEANVDLIFYAEKRVVEIPQPTAEGEDPKPPKLESKYMLWVRCPPSAQPQFRCGGRFEERLQAFAYRPDWAVIMKHLQRT